MAGELPPVEEDSATSSRTRRPEIGRNLDSITLTPIKGGHPTGLATATPSPREISIMEPAPPGAITNFVLLAGSRAWVTGSFVIRDMAWLRPIFQARPPVTLTLHPVGRAALYGQPRNESEGFGPYGRHLPPQVLQVELGIGGNGTLELPAGWLAQPGRGAGFAHMFAVDPATGSLWRGTPEPCQRPSNCGPGTFAGECASSPLDAVCERCSACSANEFESAPCRPYADRSCLRCTTCLGIFIKASNCSATEDTKCVVTSSDEFPTRTPSTRTPQPTGSPSEPGGDGLGGERSRADAHFGTGAVRLVSYVAASRLTLTLLFLTASILGKLCANHVFGRIRREYETAAVGRILSCIDASGSSFRGLLPYFTAAASYFCHLSLAIVLATQQRLSQLHELGVALLAMYSLGQAAFVALFLLLEPSMRRPQLFSILTLLLGSWRPALLIERNPTAASFGSTMGLRRDAIFMMCSIFFAIVGGVCSVLALLLVRASLDTTPTTLPMTAYLLLVCILFDCIHIISDIASLTKIASNGNHGMLASDEHIPRMVKASSLDSCIAGLDGSGQPDTPGPHGKRASLDAAPHPMRVTMVMNPAANNRQIMPSPGTQRVGQAFVPFSSTDGASTNNEFTTSYTGHECTAPLETVAESPLQMVRRSERFSVQTLGLDLMQSSPAREGDSSELALGASGSAPTVSPALIDDYLCRMGETAITNEGMRLAAQTSFFRGAPWLLPSALSAVQSPDFPNDWGRILSLLENAGTRGITDLGLVTRYNVDQGQMPGLSDYSTDRDTPEISET